MARYYVNIAGLATDSELETALGPLEEAIAAEATARQQADEVLEGAIATEASARQQGLTDLQQTIARRRHNLSLFSGATSVSASGVVSPTVGAPFAGRIAFYERVSCSISVSGLHDAENYWQIGLGILYSNGYLDQGVGSMGDLLRSIDGTPYPGFPGLISVSRDLNLQLPSWSVLYVGYCLNVAKVGNPGPIARVGISSDFYI